MAKIIAICGKICCGKSYYANQIKEKENAIILSCDELTKDLFDNNLGDKHDEMALRIWDYFKKKSVEIVNTGCNVILDWGFWSLENRKSLTEFCHSNNITCEWHYIDVDDQTWYKNIEERNQRILNGEGGSDYFLDESLLQKLLSLWEVPCKEEIDIWYTLERNIDQKEVLHGGREGKIAKEKDKVIRPGNVWTPHVQTYLSFMHENGFRNIPKPYGMNESGMEIVSYVDGIVYNDIFPDEIKTDKVVIEVAKLLRCYHNIGEKYVQKLTGEEVWMLPKRLPVEVMCHGDFAPYNITFVDGHVHGIIDFDTLHPGPRIWDIAYAVYRWVPFVSPSNPDYYSNLDEQIRRLKLFTDAYGLSKSEKEQLPSMMIKRLQTLVTYMNSEADAGNIDVQKNIEDGHLKIYLDDIQYIMDCEKKILINYEVE